MRISEVAERTGVPVGTIKFYLREELLPPGRPTTRTSSEYDDSHVERIRLIRALTVVGGLGIAAVRKVVQALDEGQQEHHMTVLCTAQEALQSASPVPEVDAARARDWALAHGWSVLEDDPLIDKLAWQWQACEQAKIPLDDARMDVYAEAMSKAAQADLTDLPEDSADAIHRVVVGAVMVDPVLSTLRRMAQRELALRCAREEGGELPPLYAPVEDDIAEYGTDTAEADVAEVDPTADPAD